jgi:hypothetical protein
MEIKAYTKTKKFDVLRIKFYDPHIGHCQDKQLYYLYSTDIFTRLDTHIAHKKTNIVDNKDTPLENLKTIPNPTCMCKHNT